MEYPNIALKFAFTVPGADLGDVFTQVNELLCESNGEGLFITAFEGVLDLVTGEFNYVNAGHEMPFICRAGEAYRAYKIKPGFVLAGMEGMGYRAGSVTLAPGDKIFQYTDGVAGGVFGSLPAPLIGVLENWGLIATTLPNAGGPMTATTLPNAGAKNPNQIPDTGIIYV